MKISSLNFKNNLRENAVLSLIHGKEMILKNEVKDFLTKDFAVQGFDETIIFDTNELDGLPVDVHRLYCEYNLPSDICFLTLSSNISHTSSETLIPFFSIEPKAFVISVWYS